MRVSPSVYRGARGELFVKKETCPTIRYGPSGTFTFTFTD
jgi:hypothetical protein